MTVSLKYTIPGQELPEPVRNPFAQPLTQRGALTRDVALGCGIIAPFQRDGKGDFRNGCGEAIIRASVERILGVVSMTDTTHGDQDWRPEFGSQIHRIRHANANDGTADLARYHVIDALRIWEPRINIVDAEVEYVQQVGANQRNGTAMEIRLLYDIISQKRGAGVLVPGVNQLVVLNGFQQVA